MNVVVDTVAAIAVLESGAECSERDRARAALNDALLGARAPTHEGPSPHGSRPTSADAGSWTVTMIVTRTPNGGRSVAALIEDDGGVVVAERTLSDRGAGGCLPLAHAVGAWATLVLDAELNRAHDPDPVPAPTSPVVASALPGGGRSPTLSADASQAAPRAGRSTQVELGTMAYLRNGLAATGGMTGLSPFITVQVGTSWVLRPALYIGRSTESVSDGHGNSAVLSQVGLRVDFCRRIPGNYVERRGIEADVCAGAESSVVTPAIGPEQTIARVEAGPSVDIRGELGGGAALELRGLFGVNLVSFASDNQTPLVYAAAEVGISVRLP